MYKSSSVFEKIIQIRVIIGLYAYTVAPLILSRLDKKQASYTTS